MTASRTHAPDAALVAPVIDCEPPPLGVAACPPPTPEALRRRTSRPSPSLRGERSTLPAVVPPRAAVAFADAALRRVLEVIDRRRPVAQLRPLVAPALIDTVLALTQGAHAGRSATQAATLRRLRVRMVDDPHTHAAEVFGTYTRGPRILAFAARIELCGERWRIVALEIR